jgi:HEAT repeat protein
MDLKSIDLNNEEEVRKALKEVYYDFKNNKETLDFLNACLSHPSWRVRKDAVDIVLVNPEIEVIKLLIDGLSSEDNAGLRNACQEALTKIGKKTAKYLIEIFDESDKDVRKFIVDIIGDIGEPEFCSFLIKALNDEDENVVIAACENLGKLKCKDAVKNLLGLLDASNQWLSFVILESIAQIGYISDAIFLTPLWKVNSLRKPILDLLPMIKPEYTIEIFRKAFCEKSSYIIENAAKSLYKLFSKNKDKLPLLKENLKDVIVYIDSLNVLLEKGSDSEKAYALCAYITENEDFFVNLLENASNEALEFFGNLSNLAPFNNKELILKLIKRYTNSKQAYLVYLCGVFGIKESIPLIIDFCNASYGHTRQALAFALGKIGGKESIDCLFSLMLDKYPDVREEAVKALSKLLNPENFPKDLVDKIINSENQEHIITVLELLSRIGCYDKGYIDKTLKSPYPKIRAKTLDLIRKLCLKDFLQDVLFYLTDEDEEVQIKAIETIGVIGNEENVSMLSNFLDRDDFNIKKTALTSIYKLSPTYIKQIEEKIFSDVHPLLFITILDLFGEGGNFSTPLIIDTALNFDDEDLFKETINAFLRAGKIHDLKIFLKALEARKGKDYVQSIAPSQVNEG